jgi:excisionase family DNA binding protein
VKPTTYQMVKLAVAGDDSLTDADREAILAFCKQPSLPVVQTQAPAKPPERWLTPPQAAIVLAVSLRTVRRMIASGRLPSRLLMGCRRIPSSAIAAPTIVEWPSGKDTPAGDCGQKNKTRSAV